MDTSLNEIGRQDKVLYAGNNLLLSSAIKKVFRTSEVLPMPLSQYEEEKSSPDTRARQLVKKFDTVIIDATYTDAARLISTCNELGVKYVAVLHNSIETVKAITALKPKRMVITSENNIIHMQTAAETIGGMKQAKGRLPRNFSLPMNYTYTFKDRTP